MMQTRSPETGVALIADLVGSRALPDRDAAQDQVLQAFADAHQEIPPLRPAWATVGDEFQAIYRTWQDAVRATLRVATTLTDPVTLRFGLGWGEFREVRTASGETPVQDGTAWYRAREAVERAGDVAEGLSTGWVGEDGPAGELSLSIQAQLLLRDHVVGRLKARESRILRRLLSGQTQQEVASAERIVQSAVSQAVHRSGAAQLLQLDELLRPREDRS